jgi:hypothetical protein
MENLGKGDGIPAFPASLQKGHEALESAVERHS